MYLSLRRALRRPLLLAALACAALVCSACLYTSDKPPAVEEVGRGPLLIRNARLFSGVPGEPVRRANILIRAGRIQTISEKAIPHDDVAGATEIDAHGKTVVPGLIDVHTHITSPMAPPWLATAPMVERTLAAFLYAGVTTVLDQGSISASAADWAAQERAGELLAPRIYHSHKPFAARGGHPTAMLRLFLPWPLASFLISRSYHQIDADNIDEIAGFIEENKAAGAAYTKIYFDEIPLEVPVIREAVVAKIVAASQAAGLPVMLHIGQNEHIEQSLAAGANIFVHGPYRSRLTPELLAKMKSARAIIAPTVTVWDAVLKLPAGQWQFDEMDQAVLDEREWNEYHDMPDDFAVAEFRAWLVESRKQAELKFENLALLRQAGITTLVATDSPNFGPLPASAIHREMRSFVERGGFSSKETLLAATTLPGRLVEAIGGEQGLGQIRRGGPADLLLVDGRPDENIRDLRRIDLIVIKGRHLRRRAQ